MLFLIPAWGWWIWTHRKTGKVILVNVLSYVAALLITLSPLAIRNMKVDVPPFAMAGHGAMAYIPMNTSFSKPEEVFHIDYPTLARIRHEAQGHMISTALKCLATFHSIGEFFGIYIKKLNGMFMWHELPNNMSYYLYKEFAPILSVLPGRYFYIAPLGLAGLCLALWRFRWKLVPFIIMLIACMLPLVIAGNLARYRTPLVIMMCLLSAYLLVQLVEWIWKKDFKKVMIGSGVVIVCFIYTISIAPKNIFTLNVNDLDPMYKLHYAVPMLTHQYQGNMEEYVNVSGKMMKDLPDYFFEAGIQDRIRVRNEADACQYASDLIQLHAEALKKLKRTEEAKYFEDKAIILRTRVNNFMSGN
jgi:hypothetical protein